MSSCTTTVSNSVRKIAPVGHTSRQPAFEQCLHTSDDINHRTPASGASVLVGDIALSARTCCSMNATCRHVLAPSAPVLSYDMARKSMPSSGTSFHSLHATSHALHPMHR